MTVDSPYLSPASGVIDPSGIARSKRFFGWAALISGLGAVTFPLLGVLGSVKGMVDAFAKLEENGSADPSALAGDISTAVLSTLWGLIFAAPLFALSILFLVLFLKKRRLLLGITPGHPAPQAPQARQP